MRLGIKEVWDWGGGMKKRWIKRLAWKKIWLGTLFWRTCPRAGWETCLIWWRTSPWARPTAGHCCTPVGWSSSRALCRCCAPGRCSVCARNNAPGSTSASAGTGHTTVTNSPSHFGFLSEQKHNYSALKLGERSIIYKCAAEVRTVA